MLNKWEGDHLLTHSESSISVYGFPLKLVQVLTGSPGNKPMQASENAKIVWIKMSRIAMQANIAINVTDQNNT